MAIADNSSVMLFQSQQRSNERNNSDLSNFEFTVSDLDECLEIEKTNVNGNVNNSTSDYYKDGTLMAMTAMDSISPTPLVGGERGGANDSDISQLFLDLYDAAEHTTANERKQEISVVQDIQDDDVFDPIPLDQIKAQQSHRIQMMIAPAADAAVCPRIAHSPVPQSNSAYRIVNSASPHIVSPNAAAPRFMAEVTNIPFVDEGRRAPSHTSDGRLGSSNHPQQHSEDEESSATSGYCPKFRGYQKDQWSVRYDQLYQFYQQHGHSSVPHTDKSNKCLARWVKRQRYQYKIRHEGKPSAMTDDRVQALERLGFVWDSHGAAWEDRLKELEEYKAQHRHCNVPSNYRANSSLASWIKCQRRQYRLFREGKKSNITQARIEQLERMGFQFKLRGNNL